MKKVLSVCLLLFFLLVFSLNSFSVKIDGQDYYDEWDNSETLTLVTGNSNSNIEVGIVKYIIDENNRDIYLKIMYIDSITSENTGVSLSVDNSASFVINVTDSYVTFDSNAYSIEAAVTVDENSGVTCEVRIGAKYGLSSVKDIYIRFIDSSSVYSNLYSFSVKTDEPISETQTVTSTQLTTVTTSTTKESETTSKKSTTTEKSTTKKNTTQKSTTQKEKTTKNKTTKSSTKEYTKNETALHSDSISFTESNIDITTSYSTTFLNSNVLSESEASNVVSVSDGKKYKTITAIAGGIALVAIAVLGTLGSNKKSDKK